MDKILILDFGSQYTQLITRRIRELEIYSEIMSCDIDPIKIKEYAPKAIILSGGSRSVNEHDAPLIPQIVFELNVPILGICYGQQALAKAFGGAVQSGSSGGYGLASLDINNHSRLLPKYASQKIDVWMSHGDCVHSAPADFVVTAKTSQTPCAIIEHRHKDIFGIQFHPEVSHTHIGMELLENFLVNIAQCSKNWKMASFIDREIAYIRNIVKEKKVVLGISGGVDSCVVAALMSKAIGGNLHCVFVDNGLLRMNEADEVKETLERNFDIHLHQYNAQDTFLQNLKGTTSPEEKRKIIGKTFIDIFKIAVKDLGDIEYLAQGTIYPDVIESLAKVGGKSETIKSHHNVGGLPKDMNLKLIEPLRFLFKDEVRKLGKELGLSDELLNRHPFPGPGLGIRVIGEVTKEKCSMLREADDIFMNELKKEGLYSKTWQAYAGLSSDKTVGVMGDARTYAHICILRAITSVDGMTADFAKLPMDFLGRVATKIVNNVKGINRVVYDITSKPPSTIELE